MTRTALSFLLTLALLGTALSAASAADRAARPPRPLRILFMVRDITVDTRYASELETQGFRVDSRPLTQRTTLEEMKTYNLIVVPDFLVLSAQYSVGGVDVPNWWDFNLPHLRQYVQEGGGLLVTTFFCEGGEALAASYDRFLGPWGAGFRPAEVVDPAHQAQIADSGMMEGMYYAWTDQIASHPATAGVKRFYYPVVNLRWDDCYTTPPILLYDKAWTPLVQAMPGAFDAKTAKDYKWQAPIGSDGTLAAVRSVGQGRVALVSLCAYYTFFRPYTTENFYGENHHGRIDGIVLSRGDGQVPSDDGRLLENLYRWVAEPGQALGLGRPRPGIKATPLPVPTVQRVLNWDTLQMPPTWAHRAIPVQVDGQWYYDEQRDPAITGEVKYFRALIGAHSAYSDGKGSVAEWVAAAQRAGYSILAFTETFEKLGGPARWEQLRRDCLKYTTADFVCLPGIDIADPEGGRYLVYGQPNYPTSSWLSEDGKYLIANNVMSICFSTATSVIARPQHTPHQYRLFKHYQGIPVATYRDGQLVDDGLVPYAWQVASTSNPMPLAVHETFAPGDVAREATVGFQQIVPADTVQHGADYFRCGLSHFFDTPIRTFVTEGPILDTWTIFNKDMGKPEENRNRYRIALGATSTVPIREVQLYQDALPAQRWTPAAKSFREELDGYIAVQHNWFLVATDTGGRRVVSPAIRTVPARYVVRCGDRQNWLGYTPHYYTGTNLPWLDIHMPVKENHEGDGIINQVKGDMLAPMCEFPLSSNRICVSDWLLGQRYVNAEKLEDIAYDAAPMRITLPSKLYEGGVRVSIITPRPGGPEVSMYEVFVDTKMDATRNGEGVWPWFVNVSGKYRPADGGPAQDITPALKVDLQPGDQVGNVVVFGPPMRLEGTRLGLKAPAETTIKAGTRFVANMFVLSEPSKAPYVDAPDFLHAADALSLTRGELERWTYMAGGKALDGGLAGAVKATPAAADPLLGISGLNPRWTAGVWRSDNALNCADQFGFADGFGLTTLDVTKAAKFYAGSFVTADNEALWLDIKEWTAEKITVEVNNPTDQAITATVQTPAEITGLKALKTQVTVGAGSSVVVKG
ncbi:MAG TPA: hypothetical protein VGM19_04865 [Armatimonadota bacterium]|jgi:hypothetical protein